MMDAMDRLREMLCRELEEIAQKGDLGTGDLDIVHKLSDTIKNIDKIEMLEESGYSRDGDWDANIRSSYGRGSSYAGRGMHYVRGHYSRMDSHDYIKHQLESLMREAQTDPAREAIRRCIDQMDA